MKVRSSAHIAVRIKRKEEKERALRTIKCYAMGKGIRDDFMFRLPNGGLWPAGVHTHVHTYTYTPRRHLTDANERTR